MTGDVVRVVREYYAFNLTKKMKELLTKDDVFLVIADDGYVTAARLKDVCIFSFSRNAFGLYTQPFCEDV